MGQLEREIDSYNEQKRQKAKEDKALDIEFGEDLTRNKKDAQIILNDRKDELRTVLTPELLHNVEAGIGKLARATWGEGYYRVLFRANPREIFDSTKIRGVDQVLLKKTSQGEMLSDSDILVSGRYEGKGYASHRRGNVLEFNPEILSQWVVMYHQPEGFERFLNEVKNVGSAQSKVKGPLGESYYYALQLVKADGTYHLAPFASNLNREAKEKELQPHAFRDRVADLPVEHDGGL